MGISSRLPALLVLSVLAWGAAGTKYTTIIAHRCAPLSQAYSAGRVLLVMVVVENRFVSPLVDVTVISAA